MTTTNISIQDLVQREVIYCVSSLIHTLTKENKLEEEQALELWTASIDYGGAKYELELERDAVFKHYCDEDNQYYFSLNEYRQEIFEHWIVTSWLGKKLQEQGETVVEDVLGIDYIWCRAATGQAIHCDWVIQEIYKDLISK